VVTRIAAAVAVVVLLVLAGGRLVAHVGMSPVLTGSMRPTYAPGDAILTRTVAVRSLRPGMIPVFVPPGESAPFAHRIVAISGDPAHPTVETRGDANPAPDAWRARLTNDRVPVVVAVVPKVGRLLVAVHQPRARALVIALLGLFTTAVAIRLTLAGAPQQPRPNPGAS
jgi:signal peptidase